MKRRNLKSRFLAPRRGFFLYLFIFLISLVFTQALRSPASAILFVFLLIIPVISIIYIAIARAAIKVYADSDKTRAEKGEPVSYEIKIINESPIPFPFVDTVVSLPSESALTCRDEYMRITLLPLGCHMIENRVQFPLRGSYNIGVKYLVIGDLFGLFRTVIRLELHRTVIVYPRSVVMAEDSNRSDTDLTTSVTKRTSTPEQAEPSDIRNYIPGDSIKNIHWKLSSKTEDLLVKNFSTNTDRHTYILCDLTFAEGLEAPVAANVSEKKSKKKKKKKGGRRDKTEQSASVAAAKSVGDAGGDGTANPKNDSRSTEDRLAALGVTPEALAASEVPEDNEEMSLIDEATRKGNKNARRKAAERLARLAMVITKEDDREEAAARSRFVEENVLFGGELCADSVIELALSAMRYEVSRGAICTILYPDSREENGLGILSSANDVPEDPSLMAFYTAPVCRNRDNFAELAAVIVQSSGMTIRMVTANTDIHSAAVFAAVPAAFGGAGSGCSAEVLLAEPKDLWASEIERATLARAMGDELARSGVSLRHFRTEPGTSGALRFISSN